MYNEFIRGLALALDVDYSEASAQWAGYSRQLTDSAREQIESNGQDSGFEIGNEIKRL